MIAEVSGTVAQVNADGCVITVGGIGIAMSCHPGVLAGLRTGQPASVATSLVVREDSLTLYGFSDSEERDLFELLQTASGVGPRLAQAVLAVLSCDDVARAITDEDLGTLCRVPGIGRKGAQRMVLELKDRVTPPLPAGAGAAAGAADTGPSGWREQVRSGLIGLGWSAKDAGAAVDGVAPLAEEQQERDGAVGVPELMRAALRSLSRS